MISKHASRCMSWEDYINLQNKNYEPLSLFKTYTVYSRVKFFWIYTTISFFKIFSSFPTCVKIFSIFFKKKFINKQYIVKKIYTVQLSLLVHLFLKKKKKKFISPFTFFFGWIIVPFTLRGRKDPVTWTNGQNNFEATCECHSRHLKLI